MYNGQRNFTITEEQKQFLEANHGKMNISQLSKMLGLTYNKTHNNLRLMGYVETRKEAKVVKMTGYFDVDEFGKYYSF